MPNIFQMKAGETRNFIVDFKDKLDTAQAQALTGTPTATEVQTSALTISDVAVNTAERIIATRTYAVMQGVEFTVTGGVTRTDYWIRFTATSNGTPEQTLIEDVRLQVL